jgi:hypothetical protein
VCTLHPAQVGLTSPPRPHHAASIQHNTLLGKVECGGFGGRKVTWCHRGSWAGAASSVNQTPNASNHPVRIPAPRELTSKSQRLLHRSSAPAASTCTPPYAPAPVHLLTLQRLMCMHLQRNSSSLCPPTLATPPRLPLLPKARHRRRTVTPCFVPAAGVPTDVGSSAATGAGTDAGTNSSTVTTVGLLALMLVLAPGIVQSCGQWLIALLHAAAWNCIECCHCWLHLPLEVQLPTFSCSWQLLGSGPPVNCCGACINADLCCCCCCCCCRCTLSAPRVFPACFMGLGPSSFHLSCQS